MGMDLSGKGGDFRFSSANWSDVLMLANDHGWNPAGTEPGQWIDPKTGELNKQMSPDPDTWDSRDYYSNSFQSVTDEDAANIADALELALEEDETSDEGLSQGSIDYLREFIAFCRAGGFSIS